MIQQHLFIGTTRERCRDFVRRFDKTGLIHAYTLTEFVHTFYDSKPKNLRFKTVSALEKMMLVRNVLKSTTLDYFSYIQVDFDKYAHTIETLVDYFHLIKMNGVDISQFNYKAAKTTDLQKIYKHFQQEMKKNDYVDYADKIDFVVANIDPDIVSDYETITLDSFENDTIHLCNPQKEKILVNQLATHATIIKSDLDKLKLTENISFNTVFSRNDEIAEVAKIIRTLLKQGADPSDIMIATGNLDKYTGMLYETMFQYQLPLFISNGIPLKHIKVFNEVIKKLNRAKTSEEVYQFIEAKLLYFNRQSTEEDPILNQSIQFNKLALKKMHDLFKACDFLNMSISEIATYFFQSVKNERVIVVNNGIPLQELNQLIFRDFKHLVLMGVDSGVLPPTPGGNFLYQPHQLESVFGLNNSYLLSQFHLRQVTGRSENLYIVSAQHEDEKQLEVSQLLLDLIPSMADQAPFNIDTTVLNKDDLLNNHKRIKLDDNSEAFLNSLQNRKFTQYDGKLSGFDHTIGYLSATQLNTYATCPLKYFFNYILKLKAPSDESEGFEVFEIGSIMHAVFEKFSIEVMEGDYVLPKTLNHVVKNRILKITISAYQERLKKLNIEENIYHKMTLKEMIKGLKDDENPGVIRTFLDYIYDPEQKNHFMLAHLSGIEHKISPDDFDVNSVPITGFIDRVDTDPTAVKLIDYKSTKNPRELNIVQKMKDLKEFQLPLYLIYAKDHLTTSASQKIEAFLFSLMAKKEYARVYYNKGKVSFRYTENRKEVIEEVDGYLDQVKDQIVSIHNDIKKGHFAFSLDEDACEYCDYVTMCHKTVLEKEVAL